MNEQNVFEKEFLEDTSFGRPHVYILGAGASAACCPNGDKNGKKLPLTKELVEVVGLDALLGSQSIGKNIEELYLDYSKQPEGHKLIALIEEKLFDYFSSLELPEKPTIYDHLLLSLREKDLVATLNWDPLLFQAHKRNFGKAKLPHIVYLHGNVAIDFCEKCKIVRPKNWPCSKCGEKCKPSSLLFPISDKNYDKDPLISYAWKAIRHYMKNAYILTIFGYGAPKSDYKAIEIFKESWGHWSKRQLEEIEIIHLPGLTEKEVSKPWRDLIHTHHYGTFDSFYHAYSAQYPRRSCECMWSALMMCNPRNEYPIPQNYEFVRLQNWLQPLIVYEDSKT